MTKENCNLAKEMFNLPEGIESFTILPIGVPDSSEILKEKICEKEELIKIV